MNHRIVQILEPIQIREDGLPTEVDEGTHELGELTPAGSN